MNQLVELRANEAVFQLQLNTRDAVRYVRKNASVAESIAVQAVKQTVTFHKQ